MSSDRLIELYIGHERVLELAGEYVDAIEVYRSLESHARRRADRHMECIAVERLVTCYIEPTSVHDPAQAEPLFERGLTLARELNDHNLEVRLLHTKIVYAPSTVAIMMVKQQVKKQ